MRYKYSGYNICVFFLIQANDPDSGPWGEVKYTIYGSGSDLWVKNLSLLPGCIWSDQILNSCTSKRYISHTLMCIWLCPGQDG